MGFEVRRRSGASGSEEQVAGEDAASPSVSRRGAQNAREGPLRPEEYQREAGFIRAAVDLPFCKRLYFNSSCLILPVIVLSLLEDLPEGVRFPEPCP